MPSPNDYRRYDFALSADRVALAMELQAKIERTDTVRRKNYTGQNAPNRYAKGYLGEFGFGRLLDAFGVDYRYEPQTSGKSDDGGDFVLFPLTGGELLVDVKTAGRPTHGEMKAPEKQFDYKRKILDGRSWVYVGARLERTVEDSVARQRGLVSVWGWMMPDEFHERAKRVPYVDDEGNTTISLQVGLGDLRRIGALLSRVRTKGASN